MRIKHLIPILFLLIACEKVDFEQEQLTDSGVAAGSSSSSRDKFRTSRHPRALTLYNSAHVIIFSDAFHPDSAELTLLSFYDWTDIPSANSTTDPTLAQLLATGYEEPSGTSVPELVEGEPSKTRSEVSWHIPTIEETKRLRDLYCSNQPALDSLNRLLQSIGAPEIALQSGKTNIRYLCDEARKSFSFVEGTTISPAGTKTLYHLRLLKTLRIYVP